MRLLQQHLKALTMANNLTMAFLESIPQIKTLLPLSFKCTPATKATLYLMFQVVALLSQCRIPSSMIQLISISS